MSSQESVVTWTTLGRIMPDRRAVAGGVDLRQKRGDGILLSGAAGPTNR